MVRVAFPFKSKFYCNFKAGTELSAPGFVVTDPDSADTKFYTMDCSGYNTGFFEMDSSNGKVYLGRDFDRDVGHPETTNCKVTVRDAGGLTATTSLTITIADINDNTPTFESSVFTFYLDPYDPVGTHVGNVSLTATDNDITASLSSVVYTVDMTAFGEHISKTGWLDLSKIPQYIHGVVLLDSVS